MTGLLYIRVLCRQHARQLQWSTAIIATDRYLRKMLDACNQHQASKAGLEDNSYSAGRSKV
jgi:hypothetical protein